MGFIIVIVVSSKDTLCNLGLFIASSKVFWKSGQRPKLINFVRAIWHDYAIPHCHTNWLSNCAWQCVTLMRFQRLPDLLITIIDGLMLLPLLSQLATLTIYHTGTWSRIKEVWLNFFNYRHFIFMSSTTYIIWTVKAFPILDSNKVPQGSHMFLKIFH